MKASLKAGKNPGSGEPATGLFFPPGGSEERAELQRGGGRLMTKAKGLRSSAIQRQTPSAGDLRRWERRKATLQKFARLKEMESINVSEPRSISVPAPAPTAPAPVRREKHHVRPSTPLRSQANAKFVGIY